jgi:hypothetical protein
VPKNGWGRVRKMMYLVRPQWQDPGRGVLFGGGCVIVDDGIPLSQVAQYMEA